MRVAVVAPSCPLKRAAAEAVQAIAAARGDCEVIIHPQCFAQAGHFAGSDEQRLGALPPIRTAAAMRGPGGRVHPFWNPYRMPVRDQVG